VLGLGLVSGVHACLLLLLLLLLLLPLLRSLLMLLLKLLLLLLPLQLQLLLLLLLPLRLLLLLLLLLLLPRLCSPPALVVAVGPSTSIMSAAVILFRFPSIGLAIVRRKSSTCRIATFFF